jgi:hypothetical protein
MVDRLKRAWRYALAFRRTYWRVGISRNRIELALFPVAFVRYGWTLDFGNVDRKALVVSFFPGFPRPGTITNCQIYKVFDTREIEW